MPFIQDQLRISILTSIFFVHVSQIPKMLQPTGMDRPVGLSIVRSRTLTMSRRPMSFFLMVLYRVPRIVHRVLGIMKEYVLAHWSWVRLALFQRMTYFFDSFSNYLELICWVRIDLHGAWLAAHSTGTSLNITSSGWILMNQYNE